MGKVTEENVNEAGKVSQVVQGTWSKMYTCHCILHIVRKGVESECRASHISNKNLKYLDRSAVKIHSLDLMVNFHYKLSIVQTSCPCWVSEDVAKSANYYISTIRPSIIKPFWPRWSYKYFFQFCIAGSSDSLRRIKYWVVATCICPTSKTDLPKRLQQWSYWREHLKYVWNVYCDVTNYRRDHHTTETTGNERFPICHGTSYFHFVLTFSLFTSI